MMVNRDIDLELSVCPYIYFAKNKESWARMYRVVKCNAFEVHAMNQGKEVEFDFGEHGTVGVLSGLPTDGSLVQWNNCKSQYECRPIRIGTIYEQNPIDGSGDDYVNAFYEFMEKVDGLKRLGFVGDIEDSKEST